MTDTVLQEIITRQEGYGDYQVQGLRAALTSQKAYGACEMLYLLHQALERFPDDDVIAKSVLKKMFNGYLRELDSPVMT